MTHILSKQSYNDILNGLRETKEWLNKLNIPFSKSRFGQYEKNMKMLNEHFEKDKVKEFLKMTDFEDVVVSLNESMEIVDIYTQLKHHNPDFLKRKLKLMIKGPFLTKEENVDRGTNIARNTFYELYTTAVLKRAGFEILFDQPSDVACSSDSKIVLFECKRPQTKDAVKRNLRSAVRQLTKSLNDLSTANARGIVAILVSKILNRGDKLLIGRNEGDLSKTINRILDGIAEQFAALHRKVIDTRIIGTFYHLNTPAVIQDTNSLTNVQQILIYPTCLQDSSDFLLLEMFEKRLIVL